MEYSREQTSDQQGARPTQEKRRGSILRVADSYPQPRSKKVSFADDEDSQPIHVIHEIDQLAANPSVLIPGQSKCCSLW